MNALHVSDNITRLRRDKKITQEQFADFIGVTKASISKWENGLSIPDVSLLPQIAAFFDVTIDELLGYEPQLTKEQIRKQYLDLAKAFANEPFEAVMEKSIGLVKQYYSCYPFLFQISCLWLNHFMLAKEGERQVEILSQASKLCSRILSDCKEISLCNDAVLLDAMIKLQMGKAQEVIEVLEEIQNPCRLSLQGDGVLIHAYQMKGEREKADSFTQISMYSHLLALISGATEYIAIHMDNLDICRETERRITDVANIFHLGQLHPNSMGLFYYQAAIVYSTHGEKKEALRMLKEFTAFMHCLLEGGEIVLHGDDYFTKLEEWFEQLDLGNRAPRDKKVIIDSAVGAFSHPAFCVLQEEKEFQELKRSLNKAFE